MASHIKRVEVRGLHGRLNLELDFRPDINILYGRNGTGKTTLLHILANVLNGSIERFAYLDFEEITVVTSDDRVIELRRSPGMPPESDKIALRLDGRLLAPFTPVAVQAMESPPGTAATYGSNAIAAEMIEKLRRASTELPVSGATYFPAFRTMIDAWWAAAADETSAILESSLQPLLPDGPFARFVRSQVRQSRLPGLARSLFGQFVPEVNYPSVLEVETNLGEAIRDAAVQIAVNHEFMIPEMLLDAYEALFRAQPTSNESPEQIWHDVERLLNDLREHEIMGMTDAGRNRAFRRIVVDIPALYRNAPEPAAANLLSVLRRLLTEQLREQQAAMAPLDSYVAAVNDFLENKQLAIVPAETNGATARVVIEFDDGAREDLRSLSSGERQIVTMLYAASRAAPEGVVLIDEPELSLHVDWQRRLLSRMGDQLGDRQVIVATHSPEIGADHEDTLQEVLPSPSNAHDEAGDTSASEQTLVEIAR